MIVENWKKKQLPRKSLQLLPYMTQFYNLDAVISVGYRVNSIRATQFRQWATSVLPPIPK